MQDQLTSGPMNLQQPRSDLQQGASTLQQSGGTSQSNTSNPNQIPQTAVLEVETMTQAQPGQRVESAAQVTPANDLFLLLLIVPVLLALSLWPRKNTTSAATAPEAQQPEIHEVVPVAQAITTRPKPKSKKKSAKRKKSGKR